MEYEQYNHHGELVWVRQDLKGHHREYCLCHECTKLNTDDPQKNCPVAQMLFELDKKADITTPVWECPNFKRKTSGQNRESNHLCDTSTSFTEA